MTILRHHRDTAEAVGVIVQMAMALDTEGLNAIIDHGSAYDTAGPVLDPTGWREHHRKNRRETEMYKAVRALRVELERLRSEILQERGITI